MFVGTVSVSRREMGLHLIDPVPPLPHDHQTMHSAIIWVLMLSFLVQNKPTISAPPPSCCRQNTYTHSQTKGKDNNGYHITFAGQRQVFQCWQVMTHELGTKFFPLLVSYFLKTQFRGFSVPQTSSNKLKLALLLIWSAKPLLWPQRSWFMY